VKRTIALVVCLTLLSACQTPLLLAPTPEVLKDERFNLFEANPEPLTSNEFVTLYATTRKPDERRSDFFRGQRDEDRLHLGYAVVRIGKKDLRLRDLIEQSTTGDREEKFAWKLLDAPIVGTTGTITEPSDPSGLSEEMAEAISRLNGYIDENPIKELTIYAHGANNTFYWSVSQGAQFQYFTGDNAMVLSFSWPSPGSIWRYGADKRRSDAAASDLALLIELLARYSHATRINLLAYSAGGRVVGGALAQLADRHQDWESLRIGQVYLTQSDQALIDFVNALPKFFPLVEGLTVTAAVGDPVLALARLTDTQLRLGAVGEGDGVQLDISDELRQEVIDIVNSDRMVLIDLRQVPATEYRFTHGAWYDDPWVSTDVMVTLLGGLNAEERGLELTSVEGVHVWIFPDDYIDRVKTQILNRQEANRAEVPPDS
jgi:esterase/lipase superfamily enzyme